MTVAEFIKLWDSINISTIPTKYYYKNKYVLKHDLYKNNNILHTIKIKCTQQELNEYDCAIVHSTLEEFNYDQQQFYDELHLEFPEGTTTYTLHIYIG